MNWIFNYIILYIMASYQTFKERLRYKNEEFYDRIKTEWFDQPDTVFEDIINGLRQETINMNYGSNSNDERRAIEQPIFNDYKNTKLEYLNKYSNTFLIFFLKLFGTVDKLEDIMTQDILEYFYNIESNIDEFINKYKNSSDFKYYENNNLLILYSDLYYMTDYFIESLNELYRNMITFMRKEPMNKLFNNRKIPEELKDIIYNYITINQPTQPGNYKKLNTNNMVNRQIVMFNGNNFNGGKKYKKIKNKRKTNKKIKNKRKTNKKIRIKRKNKK